MLQDSHASLHTVVMCQPSARLHILCEREQCIACGLRSNASLVGSGAMHRCGACGLGPQYLPLLTGHAKLGRPEGNVVTPLGHLCERYGCVQLLHSGTHLWLAGCH